MHESHIGSHTGSIWGLMLPAASDKTAVNLIPDSGPQRTPSRAAFYDPPTALLPLIPIGES